MVCSKCGLAVQPNADGPRCVAHGPVSAIQIFEPATTFRPTTVTVCGPRPSRGTAAAILAMAALGALALGAAPIGALVGPPTWKGKRV